MPSGCTVRHHFQLQRYSLWRDEIALHAGMPAGVNVQGYVGLIGKGDFKDALELIRQDLPIPSVCGRACTIRANPRARGRNWMNPFPLWS